MKNKRGQIPPTMKEIPKIKSKWKIWMLLILILIAIGIGIYFWLSGGSDGGTSIFGGSSIPSPPALPSG